MLNAQLRDKDYIANIRLKRIEELELEIKKYIRIIEQQDEIIESFKKACTYERTLPVMRTGVKHGWNVSKQDRTDRTTPTDGR